MHIPRHTSTSYVNKPQRKTNHSPDMFGNRRSRQHLPTHIIHPNTDKKKKLLADFAGRLQHKMELISSRERETHRVSIEPGIASAADARA